MTWIKHLIQCQKYYFKNTYIGYNFRGKILFSGSYKFPLVLEFEDLLAESLALEIKDFDILKKKNYI